MIAAPLLQGAYLIKKLETDFMMLLDRARIASTYHMETEACRFYDETLSRQKEKEQALEDVGSGFSSFADLRDYPIDIVKVDRSILNAAVTQRGAALLRGIAALVHSLEMKVLCEDAETRAQADLLREIGSDYIQGYYFYRPLPLKEAELILANIDDREISGHL